jgi:hypothetical protein
MQLQATPADVLRDNAATSPGPDAVTDAAREPVRQLTTALGLRRRPARVNAVTAVVGEEPPPLDSDQRPLASVHGDQERLIPGFPASASQRWPGGVGPRPGTDGTGHDRPARWLTASMLSLAVLAAASAVVSYAAQYRMVFAAKAVAPVAALEAAIPDVAALVFATLGIALALHGRRAIRARVLNVAAVATSVAMNVLAAGHGWRDLAIWAMPPVAYALASDTAIGVVRAWTLARQRALREALVDDEATPLAILAGLLLWLLRLTLAPASTLGGFRAWVVEECPVAPGRRHRPAAGAAKSAASRVPGARAITAGRPARRGGGAREGTKTARFLALAADRYGPLEAFPLADVSRVSAELALAVGLDPGAARTALRRHVKSLQNGSAR